MTIQTVTMESVHTSNFASRANNVWTRHILSPNALPHLQDAFDRAHDVLDARSIEEIAAISEVVDKFLEEPTVDLARFATWLENINLENGVMLSKFQCHELYAVLCIMYVRDAQTIQRIPRSRKHLLSTLRRTIEPKNLPDTPLARAMADTIKSFSTDVLPNIVDAHEPYRRVVHANRFNLAAGSAMRAIESIGMAERLIAEASTRASEQKKRQAASETANDARHAHNRKAKELVCRDWATDPYRWMSTPKAAEHYVPWLYSKGFECKPRTVAGWIRSHAKEVGPKLR